MAKETAAQRKTAGRVMHEFAHGELKSGPGGKAGKVKSRKQAIAIALSEAGASKYDSKAQNERHLAESKEKEATGETAQQEAEGKSHVGARGKRESSRAMGGENAHQVTRHRGAAKKAGKKAGKKAASKKKAGKKAAPKKKAAKKTARRKTARKSR
jgi:hypothetical protein